MQLVSPRDSLGDGPSAADRTQFFRVERHDALDCLTATFRRHVFAPHTHETYVVGAIVEGLHVYRHRGSLVRSAAGDLCFINPGEVHDGSPVGGGYSYRMTYPCEALLRSIAEDIAGRRVGPPRFAQPVVHDVVLARRFARAHGLLQSAAEPIAADEALHGVLAAMISRYGGGLDDNRHAGAEAKAVVRAKDFLDARQADAVELDEVSKHVGLTSFHLIRVFSRETGLTPHAWLVDRRVHSAAKRLKTGEGPAAVASACGFSDQSHLTRAFKARLGVTPGQYRAIVQRAA